MKKLIMAVAIVCATAVAQAATANWKMTAKDICNGTGSDVALANGTAFVFDADQMSQAALFALLEAGTTLSTAITGYVTEANVADGKITGTTFGYGEQGGDATTFYFVIVDGNNVYFSNEKSLTPNATATEKSLTFGSQANSTIQAESGFQGEGKWSSTAAVPEPTSAMLIVLGVAALALRRKRAQPQTVAASAAITSETNRRPPKWWPSAFLRLGLSVSGRARISSVDIAHPQDRCQLGATGITWDEWDR